MEMKMKQPLSPVSLGYQQARQLNQAYFEARLSPFAVRCSDQRHVRGVVGTLLLPRKCAAEREWCTSTMYFVRVDHLVPDQA